MEVNISGQLMDVEKKEYDYDGKKGISYKIIIYSDGSLYKVNVNPEQYLDYEKCVGTSVNVCCSIYVRGSYNLKLN